MHGKQRLAYAIAARRPYLPSAAAVSIRIVRLSLRLAMSYWYGKFEVATTQSPSVRTTSIACAVVSYSSSYCDCTARAMICLADHGGLAAWREHYWCSTRASNGAGCGPAGTTRLQAPSLRIVPRLEAYERQGLPMSYLRYPASLSRIVVPTPHTFCRPHT